LNQQFVVPSVVCDGSNRRVLMAAQFDGLSAPTIEQAGLEIKCDPGNAAPIYDGFYNGTGVGFHEVVFAPVSGQGPGISHPLPGDLFSINIQSSQSGEFGLLISDARPNGSAGGSASALISDGSAGTIAGCLVESPGIAMPHFGSIKVGSCRVSSNTPGQPYGWDITGGIRALQAGQPKPNFTETGYKMVNSKGGVRVAVTSENADLTYSLIQLAP
jgi:hypothetical protein